MKDIYITLSQRCREDVYDTFDNLTGNALFYALVAHCQHTDDSMFIFNSLVEIKKSDPDDLPEEPFVIYAATIGDKAWRRWQRDGIYMLTPEEDLYETKASIAYSFGCSMQGLY